MAWTNTGGGDHEGDDWTADGLTISGVHTNIGAFDISTGQTATINTATALEIYASSIEVAGTLQGNGKGFAGGAMSSGDGPGGGGISTYSCEWPGAGGGGYGNDGGAGTAGTAGSENGSISSYAIVKGSGGGSTNNEGQGLYGAGGPGGASIYLSAQLLSVTGAIYCNGSNGGVAHGGGGGGGSGGGILLSGNYVTAAGIFSLTGGNGANAVASSGGGGGGGGSSGRLKIFYGSAIDISGITVTLTVGTGGTGSCAAGSVGGIGTSYTEQLPSLAYVTSAIIIF